MNSSMTSRPTRLLWETNRQKVQRLYMDEDRSLEDVMNIMRSQCDLDATKAQWEAQFKKWGFKKNATGKEWERLGRYLSFHHVDVSHVDIMLRGRLLTERRVKKEIRRYRGTQGPGRGPQAVSLVEAPLLPSGFCLLAKAPITEEPLTKLEVTPVILYTQISNFDILQAIQPRSTNDFRSMIRSQQLRYCQTLPRTAEIPNLQIDSMPNATLSTHVDDVLPRMRSILPSSQRAYPTIENDGQGHGYGSPPDASMTRHINLVYVHLLVYALCNNMIKSLPGIGYSEAWLYLKSLMNSSDCFHLVQLLRAAKGKVLFWQLLRCAIEADDNLGVTELLKLKGDGIVIADITYTRRFLGEQYVLNAVEYAACRGRVRALDALRSSGISIDDVGPSARKRLKSEKGGPLLWAINAIKASSPHDDRRRRAAQYLVKSGVLIPAGFLTLWLEPSNDDGEFLVHNYWNRNFEQFLHDTKDFHRAWIKEGAVHEALEAHADEEGQAFWILLKTMIAECEKHGETLDFHRPKGTRSLMAIAKTMTNPGFYHYLASYGYELDEEELPGQSKSSLEIWTEDSCFMNGEWTCTGSAEVPDPPLTDALLNESSEVTTVSSSARSCLGARLWDLISRKDEIGALSEMESQIDLLPEEMFKMGCSVCTPSCLWIKDEGWWRLISLSMESKLDKLTQMMLQLHLFEFSSNGKILEMALKHGDQFTIDYIAFGGVSLTNSWAQTSIDRWERERLVKFMIKNINQDFLEAVIASGGHFEKGIGGKLPNEASAYVLQLITDNSITMPFSHPHESLPQGCSISDFLCMALSRSRPQPTPRQNSLFFADALLCAIRSGNMSLVEEICKKKIDIHIFEPLASAKGRWEDMYRRGAVFLGYVDPSTSAEFFDFTATLLGHVFLADASLDSKHCCVVMHRYFQRGKIDRMALNSMIQRYNSESHDRRRLLATHTPLLMAIGLCRLHLTQTLVKEFDANVNLPPTRGILRTPLQMACMVGSRDIVEFLLEHGADVNGPIAINGGATALQLAAIGGFCGIMKILIDKGADVNAPGARYYGRTALEGAAEHGRLDAVNLLLCSGIKFGGSYRVHFDNAVAYAREEGHIPLAEFMEEWDARNTCTEGA